MLRLVPVVPCGAFNYPGRCRRMRGHCWMTRRDDPETIPDEGVMVLSSMLIPSAICYACACAGEQTLEAHNTLVGSCMPLFFCPWRLVAAAEGLVLASDSGRKVRNLSE